jgi:hypothetical protein
MLLDHITGRGSRHGTAALARRIGMRGSVVAEASPAAAARQDAEDARKRKRAVAWLTPPPLITAELSEARRRYVAYWVHRGLPLETAEAMWRGAAPTTWPWKPGDHADPVALRRRRNDVPQGAIYYAYSLRRPDGEPAAAVLALDAEGRKAQVAEWDGGSRRYYGGMPPGTHFLGPELRADVEPLPGVPQGTRVVVGEGIESTIALAAGIGGLPVACLDAGHMASLLKCAKVQESLVTAGAHLVVAVDLEPSGAGVRAASALLRLAEEHGIPAVALLPPQRYHLEDPRHPGGPCSDWADVLLAEAASGAGLAGVTAAALEAAEDPLAIPATEAESPQAAAAQEPDEDDELTELPSFAPPAAWREPTQGEPDEAARRVEAVRADLPDYIAASVRPGADGAAPRRTLVRPQMGTGKSRAAALAASKVPNTALVAATRKQRDTLAAVAGAEVYPARTDDPDDLGYCARMEIVEPLAEQRRSIAAHACADCPIGLATMAVIKAEGIPEGTPRELSAKGLCPWVVSTERAREAAPAAATAAKLAGAPTDVRRIRIRRGELEDRPIVLDDCATVADLEDAAIADVLVWIGVVERRPPDWHRAQAMGCRERAGRASDEEERRHLHALAAGHDRIADAMEEHDAPARLRALARTMEEGGDGWVRVDTAAGDWPALRAMALDPRLRWQDATDAESVWRHADGEMEIPLRALQSLGGGIAREVVWVRRGMIKWGVPGVATVLLRGDEHSPEPLEQTPCPAPVTILDATPSLHLETLLRQVGGEVAAAEAMSGNVEIVQRWAGLHGHRACDDGTSSQTREMERLLAVLRQAAAEARPGDMIASITHRSLVFALLRRHEKDFKAAGLAVDDEPGPGGFRLPATLVGRADVTVRLGWWGYSERAHNEWETASRLILFGVPQLSPSGQEQIYCAERAALGLPATWDARRKMRQYKIPGQPDGHIRAQGWADDGIDAWARDWTTSRTVQAIGRLRAVARPHDHLRVDVWTTVPLAEAHGMRVDRIETDAPWRTAAQYNAARTDDADHRCRTAIVGLRAEGRTTTRAAVEAWLRTRGLTGVGPQVYRRVRAAVSDGSVSIRMRYRPLRRRPKGLLTDAALLAREGGVSPRPGWRVAALARRWVRLHAPRRPSTEAVHPPRAG